MPVKNNGYFNDPAFAQAAANLSSIFAPPSGSDAAGWAAAKAKNAEAERLSWLFSNYGDPSASARSALTGVQSYQATPGGFAATDATNRYKIGVDDATARAKIAADTQRQLAEAIMRPIGANETMNVPPAIAGQYGVAPMLPGIVKLGQGEQATLPSGQVIAGQQKPLSESEMKAIAFGQLPAAEQRAAVLGSTPVENVVTPNGPQITWRADSIGQTPYFDPKTAPKPTNGMAVLPDGKTTVPAVQGPDGVWKHAQTGQQLPADVRIFDTPRPQGTNADLGVGKPTANRIEQQLIDVAIAKDTAVKLRDLIQQSPASQGAVGWLRGTAQSLLQTGGELGKYFGGELAQINDAIQKGAMDANLAGAFDPNIPAIEMLSNLLAFQYAKTTTGERLSNEMLRASKAALGLNGLTANQADATARLNQAIERIGASEGILRSAMKGGVEALSQPMPPPAPLPNAAGAAPQAQPFGAPERWVRNPQTGKLQRAQ